VNFDLARALRSQGKAIPDHPVFHDNVPVSVYSPGASRQDAKISQREAGRHLDGYGGSQAIDYLMDCVDLYADTTSSASWRLKDADGVPMVKTKTKTTPPEYKEGPAALYTLLEQPNEHMLYHELVALLVIDLLIAGNGYWLKWRVNSQGQPLALFRLAPQYVKIIPGAFGPKRYEYQPRGAKDPLKFNPEEVLHFRRPNPHNAYYGLGIVRGGGRAYDFELSLTESMSAYMENKAEPSLIVQSERRVPRDVFQKLRSQLRARAGGARNAGELLVLEAGLTATTLSPTAQQAMFTDLSHLSRDRIFAMFRASPKLFGYTDSSGGNDKVSDARREFDTYVMRPFMDRLQKLISVGLTQAWGVDFEIEYRYTLPLEELVKNVGLISAVPGIKVREVRRFAAPLDIPESTGDPEIDEMVLNLPGEEMDENGQGGQADRNLPGEKGRPPKGENTRSFNQAVSRAGAKSIDEILSDLSTLEARVEAKALVARPTTSKGTPRVAGENRPADIFADDRLRDVDDIAGQIQAGLADAARVLERELLDHVEGKAFRPNNLRSRLRNSKAWTTFSERVEEVLMDAARAAVSRSVMQSGRVPEEDLDYDAIAESVVKRPEGLRSIVRTTKERLLKRVAAKLEQKGVTQDDVQSEVQEFVREWSADTGQSGVIGVSEAVEAYNEGTLSVAEVMGIDEVYVVEEDDAPDAPCLDANGQLWKLDHARANRKEHPNCRRAFLLPEATVA
jgi:HK97 family phage portal protein